MYLKIIGNKMLDRIGLFLMFGVLATLVLAAHNLNSYCLGLLFLTVLLKGDFSKSIKNAWSEPFFKACLLLFVITALGLLYATNKAQAFSKIEKSAGLVVIPFTLCSRRLAEILKWRTIAFSLITILLFLSITCLAASAFRYFSSHDITHFFYYELVSILGLHPVYLSALVIIGIVALVEDRPVPFKIHNFFRILMICYFSIFVILLSSKLMLGLLLLYFGYKIFRAGHLKWYIPVVALTLAVGAIIFTKNPLRLRFEDAMSLDMEKFSSTDLSQAYFNGLEFRVIQWKLVVEVLNDHNSWLVGTSPADAQAFLVEKYRDYHFYEGVAGTTNHGYLDYNAHNQFLQCLLQSGIVGLFGFLFICYVLIHMAIKKRSVQLTMLTILLIAFCLTESVLQTQKGIVTFTLFPLLLFFDNSSPQINAD
jgi:O-antigen ligase